MRSLSLLLALSFLASAGYTQPAAPPASDADGQGVSVSDELLAHRRSAIAQLVSGPRAPLDSLTARGLRYYPPNDTFRVSTVVLPLPDTGAVAFATSDGATKLYRAYARVFFRLRGTLHGVTVFAPQGAARNPFLRDRLFLPIRDATSGFGSYGGGRYLDVSRRAVDAGTLTLDFNRAYNPWCAYADGYSCPVPPPENELAIAIRAGEADYARGGQ